MAGGRIKQTVETEFTTKGASKVKKDTDQIGKAQTRLGQASASSGRQFSAQASGLGGLVAAYAGAAANVFALQQAFSALQRAAQAETIVRGSKTLALEIGESGARILENIEYAGTAIWGYPAGLQYELIESGSGTGIRLLNASGDISPIAQNKVLCLEELDVKSKELKEWKDRWANKYVDEDEEEKITTNYIKIKDN